MIFMMVNSKYLVLVAIICLTALSVNEMLVEGRSSLEQIIPIKDNPQLDSFGMAIFLVGITRFSLSLTKLFLAIISKGVPKS